MQQIIKMGLLPIYPGFYRHSANLMSKVKEENENLIKLREFIASVSKKRVDQANGLILEYHRVTEKKVKDEVRVTDNVEEGSC